MGGRVAALRAQAGNQRCNGQSLRPRAGHHAALVAVAAQQRHHGIGQVLHGQGLDACREHRPRQHQQGQARQPHEQGSAGTPLAKHHAGAQHHTAQGGTWGRSQAQQVLVSSALGAGVAGGAGLHAQSGDLHHMPHACLLARLKQCHRGVVVHGINGARRCVAQHAHGIDHSVYALQARQPGGGVGVAGKVHGHARAVMPSWRMPCVHRVPGPAQRGGNGAANEAGGTGQEHLHGGGGCGGGSHGGPFRLSGFRAFGLLGF